MVCEFINSQPVRSAFVGTQRAVLASGYPVGLLQIKGPLTKILKDIGCPPSLLQRESGERTTKGVDNSPQLLIGLFVWFRLAQRELPAAHAEGRPLRCLLYNGGGRDWLNSPPPLPYCKVRFVVHQHLTSQMESAIKKLPAVAEGQEYKTLGQLCNNLNEARVRLGEGAHLVEVYVQGSPDVRNKAQPKGRGRRFGVHWADVVVGNTRIEDVG